MTKNLKMKYLSGGAILAAMLLMIAPQAQADTLDLTTAGASGVINGATYIQGATLSGTGRFPAFVQIAGNNDVKSAYNTTENNVNDNGASDQFNHEIQLQDIPIVTIEGVDYYSFFLDINENNNSIDQWLSLDQVVVLTSDTPNQDSEPLPAGDVRYTMDNGGDNEVLLDYTLSPGSGQADMELLIPVANFAGALGTDYVYLFSEFGAKGLVDGKDWGNSDGFEEWALGRGTETIPTPEPASLVLLGFGLLGAAAALRRRVQR